MGYSMKFSEEKYESGLKWCSAQGHSCFFGSKVSFFRVAQLACRYKVEPSAFTISGSGEDVIYGKIVCGSTILALMVVALEDVLPAQHYRLEWNVHIGKQPNNGGPGIAGGNRAKISAVYVGDHFSFLQKNKQKSFVDRAQTHSSIVLVEHEYFSRHFALFA